MCVILSGPLEGPPGMYWGSLCRFEATVRHLGAFRANSEACWALLKPSWKPYWGILHLRRDCALTRNLRGAYAHEDSKNARRLHRRVSSVRTARSTKPCALPRLDRPRPEAEKAENPKNLQTNTETSMHFTSLGPLGKPLGGLLGRLGGLLDRLGGLLGRLEGISGEVGGLLVPLEPSWRPSEPLLGYLEASGGLLGGN